MSNSPAAKVCPVLEAISKKLFGFDMVDCKEQARMIHRAAKAGAEAAKKIQQEQAIRSFLAFIGSDFRVKTELSDLKTDIITGYGRYELGFLLKKWQEGRP